MPDIGPLESGVQADQIATLKRNDRDEMKWAAHPAMAMRLLKELFFGDI